VHEYIFGSSVEYFHKWLEASDSLSESTYAERILVEHLILELSELDKS
jgi:hypothetical protein